MLSPGQLSVVLGSFLFDKVDWSLARPLVDGLEPVSFAKGAQVYSAHNFQRSIGLVLSGELAVLKGEAVVLNTLGMGDCFGVAALFNPAQCYVTTILARRSSTVAFLSDRELLHLFETIPVTAVNYISFLSERINFLNHKIDSFTAPTAQVGLIHHLLNNQRDGMVPLPGGYAQLARQLGVGRASLYRSLERLEQTGVIARREKALEVLNQAALLEQCPNR